MRSEMRARLDDGIDQLRRIAEIFLPKGFAGRVEIGHAHADERRRESVLMEPVRVAAAACPADAHGESFFRARRPEETHQRVVFGNAESFVEFLRLHFRPSFGEIVFHAPERRLHGAHHGEKLFLIQAPRFRMDTARLRYDIRSPSAFDHAGIAGRFFVDTPVGHAGNGERRHAHGVHALFRCDARMGCPAAHGAGHLVFSRPLCDQRPRRAVRIEDIAEVNAFRMLPVEMAGTGEARFFLHGENGFHFPVRDHGLFHHCERFHDRRDAGLIVAAENGVPLRAEYAVFQHRFDVPAVLHAVHVRREGDARHAFRRRREYGDEIAALPAGSFPGAVFRHPRADLFQTRFQIIPHRAFIAAGRVDADEIAECLFQSFFLNHTIPPSFSIYLTPEGCGAQRKDGGEQYRRRPLPLRRWCALHQRLLSWFPHGAGAHPSLP